MSPDSLTRTSSNPKHFYESFVPDARRSWTSYLSQAYKRFQFRCMTKQIEWATKKTKDVVSFFPCLVFVTGWSLLPFWDDWRLPLSLSQKSFKMQWWSFSCSFQPATSLFPTSQSTLWSRHSSPTSKPVVNWWTRIDCTIVQSYYIAEYWSLLIRVLLMPPTMSTRIVGQIVLSCILSTAISISM